MLGLKLIHFSKRAIGIITSQALDASETTLMWINEFLDQESYI